MASGWWSSTHANLDEVSPIDFAVTTGPAAPRGYPKLGSIATGAGHFLGGRPCVAVDDVIYYAGDDYTQDTDEPILCRYDGRVSTTVLSVPDNGATPRKAILSMVEDDDNIYFSTWDAGTTAATFTGRVWKFNITSGVLDTFGDDIFTVGRLPYALTIQGTNLVVGTNAQDPTKHGLVILIALGTETTTVDKVFQSGEIDPPVLTSATRATTTYSYVVTSVTAGGVESGGSAVTQVVNDPDLTASTYNTIIRGALPTGGSTCNIYRTVGESSTGKISTGAGLTLADTGLAAGAAAPAAKVTTVTSGSASSLGGSGQTFQYAFTVTYGGNTSDAVWSASFSGPLGSQAPGSNNVNIIVTIPYTDGLATVNIYRATGPGTTGLLKSVSSTLGSGTVNVFDNVTNGDGAAIPAPAPPSITSVTATDPTSTTTYKVTANTAEGETLPSNTVSTSAKATLSASSKVDIVWASVVGATSYNLYRTAGHTTTGKIVSATGSTSASDTGLVGGGESVPTANTTGDPIGGVGTFVNHNNDLYVGLYQEALQFPTVQKRNSSGGWTTSNTIAPGGTATAYNGFTAGILFNDVVYLGYWNDDATDLTLIRAFDGASWSTVKTISGAGARPFVAFAEVSGTLWAYGGGDGKTGILYSTTDGATWTDQSALLPSAKEAIPFMVSANVLGGF